MNEEVGPNTQFSQGYDLPIQYSNQYDKPYQDSRENPSIAKKIKRWSNFSNKENICLCRGMDQN